MDTKRKIKMLTDFKMMLDKNDIEFFPIYGTLLGFIRGNHIIPWDVDLDFGAWYHDYYKILNLKQEFDKLGYGMGDSGLACKYAHISVFYKKEGPYDFHAGISFWARDNDKIVSLKFFDNNMYYRLFGRFGKNKIYNFFAPYYRALVLFINKHEILPYSWFEKSKTIKVYDTDFKIPSDYEGYLERMYGKDWRLPVKSWSRKKHVQYNSFRIRYSFQDKKIKDLWIKREDMKDK